MTGIKTCWARFRYHHKLEESLKPLAVVKLWFWWQRKRAWWSVR